MSTSEEEISKLTHRTLVMHGREGKVIPVSNSYKLEELIDNADLAGVLALRALVDDGAAADFQPVGPRSSSWASPTKPVIAGSDE